MHKAGLISDEEMREYDALCKQPPGPYTPAQIRRIRKKTKTSQGTFATYLNTKKRTVVRWERGETKPSGPAMRLLYMVEQKGLSILI